MKNRRKTVLFLIACVVLGLAGCGSGKGQAQGQEKVEGLDKLGNVYVVSREEGSGTRDTFAALVDFDGDSNGENHKDQTREDAVIATDAREVVTKVGENMAGIGYVSAGALHETDSSRIKQLKVEGVASDETEKYLLGRSFYLAYCGELSELEQDFLTYIHSEGQEIVGEDYIPIAKSNTFLSNREPGTITVTGSTSVAPLLQELADAYMEINPNAKIVIEVTDSTDGLTQAMSGTCDLGMSSRALKDYEIELLDYEVIARDNIAVIVNMENPLENITLEQLKSIYTGDIESWQQLND